MSWEDDLSKKHGLNKAQEQRESEEKRRILLGDLAREFGVACNELQKAQSLFGRIGKIVSLHQQGNHFTLAYGSGTPSLGLKMKGDDTGFEIIEDNIVVDSVSIFYNGDSIVLESKKNQRVDTVNVMGYFIKRFDARIP
ncbi:hypothetical protein [Bdellovibrio bacteriovorus]|uniref:hypothetical protein n=1 Tax=Bdellovibrio bacteriovorus TaxID=959 RepID=UPI0035A5F630